MPSRDEPSFDDTAAFRVGSVEVCASDDAEARRGKLARLILAGTTAALALVDRRGRVQACTATAPTSEGALVWQGASDDALRDAIQHADAPVALPHCTVRPLKDDDGGVPLVLVEWPSEGLARANEARARDARRFADVSHELRTPAALIVGPVEALRDAPNLTELQRSRLDVVLRNAATLLKHVEELFDLSRADAGQSLLSYRATELASLVSLALQCFEAVAAERGIALELDAPSRLPAEVDPDRVQQVVINLVANALEHTPRGGHVRLSLRAMGNDAVLTVADQGPGVPVSERERIFARYERGDGERRLGGGGLGLAIVRAIVEQHGGTIDVDDAPTGGALFRVALPLHAPEGTPIRERPRAEPDAVLRGALAMLELAKEAPRSERAPDAPTVLVVEDDDGMRRFIEESLAGELAVMTARDGEEGLARALESRPDLVLTDVTMPRMSGEHLIAAMRAHPALEGIPILVLSGRADDAIRGQLLRQGAQDYVLKPFSAEELRARAHNLVAMKRARDLLRAHVAHQRQDIVELARAVTERSRELATAWESMRVARDTAEAASRAKSRFLQLCSHELRTPLTTVLLQLEMLQQEALTDAQRGRVQRLEGAARRLQKLVESLLEHARIETGRLPIEASTFELRELAEDVRSELEARASRSGLALIVDDGEATVHSDRSFVRLVLVNLVDNAIKFTSRGEVRVRVTRVAVGARVEVIDTGRGVPLEARLRIFDAFEQLEDVRHKHTPGIGLGLTLVQRIVEALGGRVELISEVGVGSTFVVELPDLVE